MKDSTSALLLESFDQGGVRESGGIQGLGDVRNSHFLRLGCNMG